VDHLDRGQDQKERESALDPDRLQRMGEPRAEGRKPDRKGQDDQRRREADIAERQRRR